MIGKGGGLVLGQENRPTARRLLCFPFASLGALAHRNDSQANVPGMSLRGALATLQSRGGVEQRSSVGTAHQSVPRAPARHPRPTPRCHRMPNSRRTITERHTHQRCGRDSDYHTSLTTSNAASVDGDVGGDRPECFAQDRHASGPNGHVRGWR